MPLPACSLCNVASPLTLDPAMALFWNNAFYTEEDPTSMVAIDALVRELHGCTWHEIDGEKRIWRVRSAVVRASIDRHFGGARFIGEFDHVQITAQTDAQELSTQILACALHAWRTGDGACTLAYRPSMVSRVIELADGSTEEDVKKAYTELISGRGTHIC